MTANKEVTPDTLNNVMEFDHVIRVHADGTVSDSPYSVGSTEAYFDLSVSPDGTDHFDMSDGWELLRGYTGQYSYNGPVMHSSEFIGGGMARDILATPGDYVVLEVSAPCDYDGSTDCDIETGCDCEPAGWAVAFKPLQYVVKDRVSGVTVEHAPFTDLEEAKRLVSGISHYVGTDYYVEEA